MNEEVLEQLIAAAAGKTAEQIAEELRGSANADKIDDVEGLAAMLVKAAADPEFAAQLCEQARAGTGDTGPDSEPPPPNPI